MLRWVVIRGKRVPATNPPSALPYSAALLGLVAAIKGAYLDAIAPEVRHDAITSLMGNRVALINRLRNVNRARGFAEHDIAFMVDGFLEWLGFNQLVDGFGQAIVRDSNTAFDKLVEAESERRGQKPQARIYQIDHTSKTSDMRHFLDRFRRDNTGLIRKLVGEQVTRTELILRNTQGAHVDQLRDMIQQATGTTESHAELLARDQTLKMNADVQHFRARSVGADEYIWVTANDERVRGRPGGKWADAQSNHWRLHGQRFKYNQPPVTNPVKGIRLNPGRDFQCRCTATPVLDHIFGP